jgi:hypothetical protein
VSCGEVSRQSSVVRPAGRPITCDGHGLSGDGDEAELDAGAVGAGGERVQVDVADGGEGGCAGEDEDAVAGGDREGEGEVETMAGHAAGGLGGGGPVGAADDEAGASR